MMKLELNNVRCNYVNVIDPRINQFKNKNEFSLVALVPKSNKKLVDEIKAMEKQLVGDKKYYQSILKDGDGTNGNGEPFTEKNPEYADHWFINAVKDTKPFIVDRFAQQTEDKNLFRSGNWFNVALKLYPWKFKPGVGAELLGAQFVKEGDLMQKGESGDDVVDAFKPLEEVKDNESWLK